MSLWPHRKGLITYQEGQSKPRFAYRLGDRELAFLRVRSAYFEDLEDRALEIAISRFGRIEPLAKIRLTMQDIIGWPGPWDAVIDAIQGLTRETELRFHDISQMVREHDNFQVILGFLGNQDTSYLIKQSGETTRVIGLPKTIESSGELPVATVLRKKRLWQRLFSRKEKR